MGGFMGIGGNGAKTDRSDVLGARGDLRNIFNWGLPEGKQGAAKGQATLDTALGTEGAALKSLDPAEQYYRNLLGAGRQQIAQMSAPATDAVLAAKDATTRQNASFGTGRSGGAVAAQANAGTAAQSEIDQIINKNLMSAGATGAQGMERVSEEKSRIGGEQADIGARELSTALSELGLSASAIEAILSNAQQSWRDVNKRNEDIGGGIGSFFGDMLLGGWKELPGV